MELGTDVLDLWTFNRRGGDVRYLLLHTSQEKADRFFGGGRFWQIPGGFFSGSNDVPIDLGAACDEYGLRPDKLSTVEHVYLIFNRRRNRLEAILVFAAELPEEQKPTLTWEHSDFAWVGADELHERVTFRGLLEGWNGPADTSRKSRNHARIPAVVAA